MAQDIEIANAQYNDVPSIEVPKQGGGTACFIDTSDGDAVAADVVSGKICYSNGVRIVGTGGGGGGFDTITQVDDSIYIPNGYIECSAKQTNLELSDKILILG